MSRSISLLAFFSLFAASSMLTGCASILGGGGSQGLEVTSLPSGAQIQVRDSSGKTTQTAMTPCRLQLDRGKGFFQAASYTIHATANGSERDVPVNPGLNPWYFGNILIGGVLGMVIVDPLTGAMWILPDKVNVDFNAPVIAPANPRAAVNNSPDDGSKPRLVMAPSGG